jgi:DNA-binding response OmpR family regulator
MLPTLYGCAYAGRVQVLLADDDPEALAHAMRGERRVLAWKITTQRSPAGALSDIERLPIDALATSSCFRSARMTGTELVRAARALRPSIPVLLYSSNDWTSADRAAGYDAGADCVVSFKHGHAVEVVAAVSAIIRARSKPTGRTRINDLTLDTCSGLVHVRQTRHRVSRDQVVLLSLLMARAPDVVAYPELLAALGCCATNTRHAIGEAIRRLRFKCETRDVTIEAVAGVGYRMNCDRQ